jgi:hypothetical protein
MALDRPMARARAQAPHLAASLRAFLLALATALAGGILLGLFSALGDSAKAPLVIRWLANIPGPWVLLAFLIGILAGTRVGGAIAAVLGLAAGVASYYAYLYLTGERPWLDTVEQAIVVWTLVAVAAGFVFGAAGGSWRRGAAWERILSVALLCGVLAGESILLVTQEDHPGERLMVASEAIFAVALIWGLLPRVRQRVIATMLTCGASVVAIEALIVFTNRLRDAGL